MDEIFLSGLADLALGDFGSDEAAFPETGLPEFFLLSDLLFGDLAELLFIDLDPEAGMPPDFDPDI